MYNETVYWLSRTGIGMVRSVRLISAFSYYLLGILVLVWLKHYTPAAPVLALLIMLLPPVSLLGRNTAADALSVLLGMYSLFLIFECDRLALGTALITVAIWFRTDNIALLSPVLVILWHQGRIALWKAIALGTIGVLSILVINRAAGDYGIQMLYYRNFLGTPLAPAEMVAKFAAAEYLSAFLAGFKTMLTNFVPAFILLGLIGFNKKTAPLLAIAATYAAVHYLILPNWIDRWMGVAYLIPCIAAASGFPYKAGNQKLTSVESVSPTGSLDMEVSFAGQPLATFPS
jgi:hypothetical protein